MGCPATAYRTSPVLPRGHMCPVGGARNGLRLDSAVRPTACFPLPAKASPQSRNRKSEKTTLCPNPAWKPREAKEGASNSGPTRPSGIFGSQRDSLSGGSPLLVHLPPSSPGLQAGCGAGEGSPHYGGRVWAEFQPLLFGVTLVWASVSTSAKQR